MADTDAAVLTLAECPIGLFFSADGELCLKTEYGNNEGRIDAYIVSSGEFFWGDAPQTIANQRRQMVTPVDILATLAERTRERDEARDWIDGAKSFDQCLVRAVERRKAAERERDALVIERDDAHGYMRRLFEFLAPQCKALPTVIGLATQLDNYIAGLREERDALREALGGTACRWDNDRPCWCFRDEPEGDHAAYCDAAFFALTAAGIVTNPGAALAPRPPVKEE